MHGQVSIASADALYAVYDAHTAKQAIDVIVVQIQALVNDAQSAGESIAADNLAAQNAATLAQQYATDAATKATNVYTALGPVDTHKLAIGAEATAAQGHLTTAQTAHGNAETEYNNAKNESNRTLLEEHLSAAQGYALAVKTAYDAATECHSTAV